MVLRSSSLSSEEEAIIVAKWEAETTEAVKEILRDPPPPSSPDRIALLGDGPVLAHRGATPSTWRGMWWTTDYPKAYRYAAARSTGGLDGRVFTASLPVSAVIGYIAEHMMGKKDEIHVNPAALSDVEPRSTIANPMCFLPEPRGCTIVCPKCELRLRRLPCWNCAIRSDMLRARILEGNPRRAEIEASQARLKLAFERVRASHRNAHA